MIEFELLERDGLARLGRFMTPHGPIDTPALLPVVHPDPRRQPLSPTEIRRRFGFSAVITSSYITWRGPELRARAEREGIHGLLSFDGPVMTDSGAFQQHAYGRIEVDPETILAFQGRIGSDIATVLDVFVEPHAPYEVARSGVETTLARARSARESRDGLLAVPVQGAGHAELRASSADGASDLGDVLAVGGVVPLLEQYRFRELADVLSAVRPHLTPASAVHLFGTGHPMTFAFAALAGIDLFDSSAYHKFARRGRLLFPEGSIAVDEIDEPICRCSLCEAQPLRQAARLPPEERVRALAVHNLLTSAEEMARVRQAIRDGTLWELAEQRATAHPALRAGLAALKARSEMFESTEPESRRAFRETGTTSYDRPAVVRLLRRLDAYREGRPRAASISRVPLVPSFLERIPLSDVPLGAFRWESPTAFGPIPLELTELYPVGPALTEAEYRAGAGEVRAPSLISEEIARTTGLEVPASVQNLERWDRLQLAASLEWRYGRAFSTTLVHRGLVAVRSPRTGRLRWALLNGRPAFLLGNDGIPRPTFWGAELLHEEIPSPHERVVVTEDATPFVRQGRSLFARFVLRADPRLVPGMSALLVSPQEELLAVGRLLLAPHEMARMRRGVVATVSSHRRTPLPGPGEVEEERIAPREL